MNDKNTRLTEDQVADICAQYAAGTKQRTLAARFKVKQPCISKIVRGEIHRRVRRPEMFKQCSVCKCVMTTSRKTCKQCQVKQRSEYFKRWYQEHRKRREA